MEKGSFSLRSHSHSHSCFFLYYQNKYRRRLIGGRGRAVVGTFSSMGDTQLNNLSTYIHTNLFTHALRLLKDLLYPPALTHIYPLRSRVRR